MGTEDHLHMGHLFDELLAIPLADAAAEGDDALRERRAWTQGLVFERHDMAEEPGIR